jgi:hypothetical protein
MKLKEALAKVPDPRAHNQQYPLWGLLALILVAFLCRIDSLRGVARFARETLSFSLSWACANPQATTR